MLPSQGCCCQTGLCTVWYCFMRARIKELQDLQCMREYRLAVTHLGMHHCAVVMSSRLMHIYIGSACGMPPLGFVFAAIPARTIAL